VATRYPGEADPVTPRQHRRAVRIAGAVLRWAERNVERASFTATAPQRKDHLP